MAICSPRADDAVSLSPNCVTDEKDNTLGTSGHPIADLSEIVPRIDFDACNRIIENAEGVFEIDPVLGQVDIGFG
jgi:hypothetical protein